MFKHLFCVMLAIALLGSHARAATPQQIDAAITKAKKFIYSQQKNGNWELVQARDDGNSQSPSNGQFTGRTALALLAAAPAFTGAFGRRRNRTVAAAGGASTHA